EAERQAFMIEVGNRTALFFKDLDALLEEIIARIQNLILVVARVLASLDYRQHRIYRELSTAAAESLRDVVADPEAEFLRASHTQIAGILRHGANNAVYTFSAVRPGIQIHRDDLCV